MNTDLTVTHGQMPTKEKAMIKKVLFVLLGCLLASASATAKTVVYSDNLVNETSLGADTNYDLDLQTRGIDSVSAVVTASSASIATASFVDGRVATGTLTVASLSDLTTAYATNKLTVVSKDGISGKMIRLAGIPIIEGQDWYAQSTKALTATAIAAALNAKFSGIILSTAPTGSVIVYSTATTAGKAANSLTYETDTTSITVNAASFSGGKDNAFVILDGTKLTFNVEAGVGGTTAATATNLAAAINANATLAAKMVASAGGSIVYTTATVVGAAGHYGITSSTSSRVVPSGTAFTGGVESAAPISQSNIAVTAHGMSTGYAIYFSTPTGVSLTPLVNNATYYIIKVDANNVKLATSRANAMAGTAIVITSSNSTTTSRTFSLKSANITGSPAYKWRVSNDSTYWVDLSTSTNATGLTVDQVTLGYIFGGTSKAYDLGRIGYRYLRFAVTAPTAGAIWIKNAVIGKQD